MDVKLGRDTLIALAAVAWADGSMAPEEADSLRSAAQQLGLGPQDRSAVEDAIARRIDPAEVETVGMNRPTRLFVYAAATWMATVDGHVSREEEAVLRLLGDRLGLSDKARERARQNALVADASPGGRYDLLALRTRLAAGLGEVGDD
jgi:uncharacterized membrane protein YebE (DUF533 family)